MTLRPITSLLSLVLHCEMHDTLQLAWTPPHAAPEIWEHKVSFFSFSHLLLIALPDTRLSSLLAFPWLLWLAASSSKYDKVSSLIEGSVAFFGKSAGSDSHLIQRDVHHTLAVLQCIFYT